MKKLLIGLLPSILLFGLLAGCDHVADTELVGYAYPSVANVAAMSYSKEKDGTTFNAFLHHRDPIGRILKPGAATAD